MNKLTAILLGCLVTGWIQGLKADEQSAIAQVESYGGQVLGIAKGPVWQKARERVDGLLTSTKENRAADGRLSSFYFTRAGNSRDLFAELSGTGHVFEFVAMASSQKELESEWVERSASHLCGLIENMHQQKVDCGALYHALNGLRVYHKRRWQ